MSQATWIRRFGVVLEDPGLIYLVQSGVRFKIGKTRSAKGRLAAAKTWLPDIKVVGVKPFWNASWVERCLHEGFSRCWYAGEWFEPVDEGYRETLLEGFVAFSDHDRGRNSVDFIYWFNGEGMAEFVIERGRQGLSLRQFQQQESDVSKPRADMTRRDKVLSLNAS